MVTRVLVVEDDDQIRELILAAIQSSGEKLYTVEGAASGEEAIKLVTHSKFDIIVSDICLPNISGIDLLPNLLRLCPGGVIIAISGEGTIEMAVEAMKRGASDFLLKPFKIEEFLNILRVTAARQDNKFKDKETQNISLQHAVCAVSPIMKKLLDQVATIAPFNTTVLITGETGTGKELIARSLHQQSSRSKGPFVAINCAAVPEQLLEDELFGHVKGAFTGALAAREGRFEQANGGTLFLDEIGDMSLPLQAKLLRVLQEREFEKLGTSRTIKVDVRILAATNSNLEQKMEEGTFRADLYYRLNVVQLQIPLLSNHKEDIPVLTEYFLSQFCSSVGLPSKKFDNTALEALLAYHWPGNIRQLRNAVERAAALSGISAMISLNELPDEICQNFTKSRPNLFTPVVLESEISIDKGMNFEVVVTQLERELLCKSLEKTGGNKMQAAKLLNMKRTTFVEKLKRLGITSDLDDDSAYNVSKIG